MKYLINPKRSHFSFQELKYIIQQNFAFLELACDVQFDEIEETDIEAGSIVPDMKIIGFQPKDYFPNPTYLAMAKRGVVYNADAVDSYNLSELRGLGLHELGHNLSLSHTDNPYSIMSMHKFRTKTDKSLLWHDDLINLHAKHPKPGLPIGWVTVDKELNVMIPSLWYNGEQWAVRLRHVGTHWIADKYYKAAGYLETMAELTTNDEIHLHDVSYLGFSYPLVKFQITPDFKFMLIT